MRGFPYRAATAFCEVPTVTLRQSQVDGSRPRLFESEHHVRSRLRPYHLLSHLSTTFQYQVSEQAPYSRPSSNLDTYDISCQRLRTAGLVLQTILVRQPQAHTRLSNDYLAGLDPPPHLNRNGGTRRARRCDMKITMFSRDFILTILSSADHRMRISVFQSCRSLKSSSSESFSPALSRVSCRINSSRSARVESGPSS